MKKYLQKLYNQLVRLQFDDNDIITHLPPLKFGITPPNSPPQIPKHYSDVCGYTKGVRRTHKILCIFGLLICLPVFIGLPFLFTRITHPPTSSSLANILIYVAILVYIGYLNLTFLRWYAAIKATERIPKRYY